MRTGFIGLGAMGAHMARHLHARGLLLAVGNRSAAKSTALAAELGVGHVDDAAAMAATADCIVTCVTADADVLGIVDAVVSAGRAGIVVVDTSTIASTSAIEAARRLRAVDCDFIDAPVSGGVEGARNGRLSVMAGGDAAVLARVSPVLEAFAARITHMGPVGAGQNTKAVNQVLVAGIAAAVCEGLALAEALGLEPERLIPTLQAGAAQTWFLDKRGHTMLRDEFAVGFKLALLHKDLRIVRDLAIGAGTDHSVIDKALADYARLMQLGHGDDDISGLIRLKREKRSVP